MLAISAADDEKTHRAIKLADEFAADMTAGEIEGAKAAAHEQFG